MNNAIVNSGVESDYKIILEEGFRQMAVQLQVTSLLWSFF